MFRKGSKKFRPFGGPSIKFGRRRTTSRMGLLLSKKRFSLRRRINSITEIKTVDLPYTVAATTLVSNTPAWKPIFTCVAGTGTNQRIGNKITYKSLRVQGWYTYDNTNTVGSDILRFVVIYDAQPNAALPALADVFNEYSSASGSTESVLSSPNINNTERFKILIDEKVCIPALLFSGGNPNSVFNASGNESQGKIYIDRFLKLNGLQAQFNTTNGGTVADFTKGSLLYTVYNQINPNATYEFNLTARTRFYDV